MTLLQGRYSPINPQKYDGDPTNIIYRSSWERRIMVHLDTNPNVVSWQSEEFFIPYRDPASNKVRRYFPDFLVKTKNPAGQIITTLLEIKPKNQTRPPEPPKNKSRRFIKEVMTWGTNNAKWEAAQSFCEMRGWTFKIITEDDIFGKK